MYNNNYCYNIRTRHTGVDNKLLCTHCKSLSVTDTPVVILFAHNKYSHYDKPIFIIQTRKYSRNIFES